MSKTFYFRCHAGPSAVKETVARLRAVGIDAHDGTAHAYGTVAADTATDAAGRLNRAAGYKLCDLRTGDELREVMGGGGGARARTAKVKTKAELARLRRPSPADHAADHKGARKRGHDMHLWRSVPDKNGVYRWRRV